MIKKIIRKLKTLSNTKFNKFKRGVFNASPRKFGTMCECIIEKVYNLNPSTLSNFDKVDMDGNRIEVKFSRCSSIPKKCESMIDEIINENQDVKYLNENDDSDFWCNIQQVKPSEFDYLYYGVFYKDIIKIFRIKSDEILNIPCYSNKQHRGNIGEGQFPINQKTLSWHLKNTHVQNLTYKEVFDLLK